MIQIPQNHIDQYIELFGNDPIRQIDILQEECAELIKALSKYKRAPDERAKANIIEEITHVAISSEIVAQLLKIQSSDIQEEVDRKALKYGLKEES